MYTLNLNQCLHYDICFSYSKLNVRNFIASKFALLSSLSLSSCQSAESHPSIGKSYIRESKHQDKQRKEESVQPLFKLLNLEVM